ncbi:MAG: Cof-type HAD-IIB family hydrolase [Muribaculaceae bacterium]|nr:Cof-type HAD-IIB family hydrolase [Muribaculaceae bacterium]
MSTKKKTLYVSDLDGTLLGSDSRLSRTTVALLNRAIAQGALFTVATARTPATAVPLMAEVATNLPLIVLSGAAMWDNARHGYTHTQALSPSTVSRITDIFAAHRLNPFIYRHCGDLLHVTHRGTLSDVEREFVRQRQDTPFKVFHLGDDPIGDEGEALLVFAMNDYERLKPAHEEIAANTDCHTALYLDNVDPDLGLLEVYAPGTTKAAAIARLAAQLGVERTVVFGDNLNDIPMMRAATVGVAVENAFPPVKEVADVIIGTNDSDAVARYIASEL